MKRSSRCFRLAFWIAMGVLYLLVFAISIHFLLAWIKTTPVPEPEPVATVVVVELPTATPTTQAAGSPTAHATKTPIVYATPYIPEFPPRFMLPTPTPEPTSTSRPLSTPVQKG